MSRVSRARSRSSRATGFRSIPRHMFKVFANVQVTQRVHGRRRSDWRVELPTRAATRTTCTSPTAPTTSGPAIRPATRSSISARATRSRGGCRSSRRSTTCSIAATTPRRSSEPTGFTDSGTFIARPLPPINGEFPVQALDVLRAGRADPRVDRNALHFLKRTLSTPNPNAQLPRRVCLGVGSWELGIEGYRGFSVSFCTRQFVISPT